MHRLLLLPLLCGLLLACGCPQREAAETAPVGNPAGDTATAPEDAGSVALSPEPSPLAGLVWDGQTRQLSLLQFTELLQQEGAAGLLTACDFSDFEQRTELDVSEKGDTAIVIRELPEDAAGEATPIGFEAQLIAFGEGERMIFGFSAAWYEKHMGLAPDELDAQFRSMHEEHGGVLKNYAYSDPDYDISFFQFNFDNSDESLPWGSPYMTYKRFTMHGDIPEWNFYCIGIGAGASLATRRAFEAEAARQDAAALELPQLDRARQPDALLTTVAAGAAAVLNMLELDPAVGSNMENFSLERLLKPRTLSERYILQSRESGAVLELILAERSSVQRLSFTDGYLGETGIDAAAFNARFEELHAQFDGWDKEQESSVEADISDSGVILGAWEISRRLIALPDEPLTRSWSINPAPGG